MKKKLFIVNDAHYISSGYGVYGKELLTRLHNSGKYEIAELACYCAEDNARVQECVWKIYPNNPSLKDEQKIKLYQTQKINEFGNWRFNRAILDFKPHIVFDVRDYWMSSYQEMSPYRRHFHWVIMPTVDSSPQKTEWYYTYANADIVVPYTQWAKNTLTNEGADKLNIFPKIVNAGINANEFYPINDKKEHQIKTFGRDVNVVGFVMRNQKRKLMPDLLRVFRKYLDRLKTENDPMADNTVLYFHTSYPEEAGWDIPALLLEFQLLDKVYFTYKCNKCLKWCANKYSSGIVDCPHCSIRNSAAFITTSNGLNNEQLNEVYNLFDVYIQYSICLGKNEEIRIKRNNEILWIPISKTKIGDEAWTHKNRWKPITNIWKNLTKSHNKKILELSIHGDYETLIATENHEFPAYTQTEIKNDKSRTVREKIGDKLREEKKLPEPGKYELNELKSGDMLCFPIDDTIKDIEQIDIAKEINDTYITKEDYIEVIGGYSYPRYINIDKDFCRFMGLFVADGHAANSTAKGLKITSHIKETENHYVASNAFKQLSISNVESIRPYRDRLAQDNSLWSSLHGNLFFTWFGSKEDKCLPNWCLYLPIEKQKEILVGMFMGDGHYCEEKNYSQISTISITLAEQIKHILRRLRIPFSVSKINRVEHNTTDQKNRLDCYSFEIYGCNIKKGDFSTKRNGTNNVYYQNYHLIKIKRIQESNYKDDVWCVTVEDDHTMTTKIGATFQCEGFGMPQLEAASAGVPIASVDYSAMTEICENVGGTLIPIQKKFRELETNADRVYPDNDFTSQFLYDFFKKDHNERRRLGEETRKKCIDMYTWDHTFKVWDEVFDTIDITKKVAWNDPTIFKTNHENISVPSNLSPREFVEYIVVNVINDPFLLKTSNIQCLIKDMSQRIVARRGKISGFSYKEAVEILEQIMNEKILHEEIRHHPERLLPENYLTCQTPNKK
jgi:glycosyltransferase involved in cell wall biosynthesis